MRDGPWEQDRSDNTNSLIVRIKRAVSPYLVGRLDYKPKHCIQLKKDGAKLYIWKCREEEGPAYTALRAERPGVSDLGIPACDLLPEGLDVLGP